MGRHALAALIVVREMVRHLPFVFPARASSRCLSRGGTMFCHKSVLGPSEQDRQKERR
jgi:hypothetical protein